MAPRRNRNNQDLPPNLYYTKTPNGLYYVYRNPNTKKRTALGYERNEAILAANQANAHLAITGDLLGKIMRGQTHLVQLGEYINRYKTDILPSRRVNGHALSKAYLAECVRILTRFEEHMGSQRTIAGIQQHEIAAYLNRQSSNDAYNQHRKMLAGLYTYAVSDGLAADNLPTKIVKRDRDARVRDRLTLEGYKAIYEMASPAIRNAMELSLNAMQRRADIQKWQFKDQRDGFAFIIQSKTHKHGPSAWLQIPLTLPVAHSENGATNLAEVIRACRDDVPCPYLVHQRPQRVKKSRQKTHPFQLSPKQISDGFAEARDACHQFKDMPAAKRPTFHELLALGEHLREQQGWTAEQIQLLRGHTNVKTTKGYLDGHTWTLVKVPANPGMQT